MAGFEYDPSSIESILEHANKLVGHSLQEVSNLPTEVVNAKNKGDLGTLVEKFHFGLEANNVSEPDFPEVGLELKTTGIRIGKRKSYLVKERLVLSMIDYKSIIEEEWQSSALKKKCKKMLILFYLYEKEVPIYRRKFLFHPYLFEIPDEDLATIINDWVTIRNKIEKGLAHELSEGDTFYLGACRKGAGGSGEKLRVQPNSDIPAKARAFSFKQGYMTELLERHVLSRPHESSEKPLSFDEIVRQLFIPFLGLSFDEICSQLNLHKKGKNDKAFHRKLAVSMLKMNQTSELQLKKAGVEMKTIRLRSDGKPFEAMSFPHFSYEEIVNEDWEESRFAEVLERKFLFVVFRVDSDGVDRFQQVLYWNMPFTDREEARKVWEETRRRVIAKQEEMPKAVENRVAHVRPKGKNSLDRITTPHGELWMKQCFWLNKSYVQEILSTTDSTA